LILVFLADKSLTTVVIIMISIATFSYYYYFTVECNVTGNQKRN